MDVLPTLLSVCGVKAPADVKIDGMNLEPLLSGTKAVELVDRNLFFQVHRGLTPHAYQNMAVINQRWKLVGSPGAFNKEENVVTASGPVLELYDLSVDPAEEKNLAPSHPEQLQKLREAYEKWFAEVKGTRGFKPGDIHIGNAAENPVHLCYYQDLTWAGKDPKGWQVVVEKAGKYRVSSAREAIPAGTLMVMVWQGKTVKQALKDGRAMFELEKGAGQLEVWLEDQAGQKLAIDAGGIQGDVVLEKL
jgi:arylsulfatase A